MDLKSYQRKYLRSLAHHIKPIAQVGRDGITDGLLALIDQNLKKNELAKIKFLHYKDKKKEYSNRISIKTKSHIVGSIGNILILYRISDIPANRLINLPMKP